MFCIFFYYKPLCNFFPKYTLPNGVCVPPSAALDRWCINRIDIRYVESVMSRSLSGDHCDCENRGVSDNDRIACLRKAMISFYKTRQQIDRFPKEIFDDSKRVGFIRFDTLLADVNSHTAHAAESVILLRFLHNYATTHPKFAAETSSVECFKRTTELFKEI